MSSKKMDSSKTIQVNEELRFFNLSIYRSVALMHWIGYGLLLFGFLDLFFLFISQAWSSAGWFVLVLEQFVTSMPVLLVGFGLSFFGELKPRLAWEIKIVRWLSWTTLVLSAVLLLLIPLGMYSTVQVIDQNEQGISSKGEYELLRLNTLEAKVFATHSFQELKALSQALGSSKTEAKEIKLDILQKIKFQKIKTDRNTTSQVLTANFKSIKKILKVSLSAMLASFFCFWLWKNTAWARNLRSL
jgi:hypothetical protein